MKVMSIFGTRPEAVKMCPLIKELESNQDIESIVCLTGQHQEMLKQVMDVFAVKEDYNLNIMQKEQTLSAITTSILIKTEKILKDEAPDIVLVHGDTSTSFAAALAAFYQKIPVGHVESGLRTYDRYSPFPEEMNRQMTDKIACLHFAPTKSSKENLIKEGINENIYVTGNTVIDAFKTTVKGEYTYKNPHLRELDLTDGRYILVTAHRRENLGQPLADICKAIKKLTEDFDDIKVIYPLHMNPAVRETAVRMLGGSERIYLTDPLNVEDMHNFMSRCYMVMTDSGGLQEEAPAFGIPVLVLRTETERPEAVWAGVAKVSGTDERKIYRDASILLTNKDAYRKMADAISPFGDGNASRRIVQILTDWNKQKANNL